MMRKNNLLVLVMVIVAVLGTIGMFLVAFMTPQDIAPAMSGEVSSTISYPNAGQGETVHVEIPVELEPATSVLLVDESGSMSDVVSANTHYDSIIYFSDYLYQKGGNSQIATNLMHVLDMDVQRVGVVSDLESYPRDEIHALDFKSWQSREVYIFCSEDVDQEYLQLFKEKLADALDENTSTLIFCYADGSRDVIYDNYVPTTSVIAETDVTVKPELVLPDVKILDNRKLEVGNFVPPHVVRNLLICVIAVGAFLVEIILALLLRNEGKEPDWVRKARQTDAIALDGSGSVRGIYDELLKWLKGHRSNIIYRFSDIVSKVTIDEAKAMQPSGQTHGWECLKTMCSEGYKSIAIVSDMDFNDMEDINGVSFDSILFVVPQAHNKEVLEKVKTLATAVEVIII